MQMKTLENKKTMGCHRILSLKAKGEMFQISLLYLKSFKVSKQYKGKKWKIVPIVEKVAT